jgi:hypothetical protein
MLKAENFEVDNWCCVDPSAIHPAAGFLVTEPPRASFIDDDMTLEGSQDLQKRTLAGERDW